jgi:hypothetical protein
MHAHLLGGGDTGVDVATAAARRLPKGHQVRLLVRLVLLQQPEVCSLTHARWLRRSPQSASRQHEKVPVKCYGHRCTAPIRIGRTRRHGYLKSAVLLHTLGGRCKPERVETCVSGSRR